MIAPTLVSSLAALALLAAAAAPLGAAPPSADPIGPVDPAAAALAGRLEGMLEPVRRRHGLPALAAAVVVAGRTEAAGAVGRRRIDAPIPVTIHDRFHIGSDTKAMTALLAAIAVERGLLRWDSSLGEVFPELRGVMAPGVAAVTLRQLLSHGSGIGDATLQATLALAARQPGNLDRQRLAMVGQIVRQPLLSPPGSRWLYGNHNYVLAGAMLERRQRRTWEELIQEQLFAPLGLRSAGLGPAARAGLTDAPLGHERRDGRLRPLLAGPNADNPAVLGPAGLAHLSLLDFARWAGWNAGQGRRGPALVPAAALRLLHTPVIGTDPAAPLEGYALGWGVAPLPGGAGPLLSHDGSNTMNLARVLVDPGRDLAVVLSTNVAGPEALAAFAELAPRLLELAAAWPQRRRVAVAPGVALEVRDWSHLTPADRRQRPPLVLLAGLGNGAAVFDALAPRLAAGRPVLAISRRGFGGSSAPAGGYDVPRRVEDLRRALAGLGLGRVVLVGHSIAGDELTAFAARHPHQLAGLVYLDAALNRFRLAGNDPAQACSAPLLRRLEVQALAEGWRRSASGELLAPSLEAYARGMERTFGGAIVPPVELAAGAAGAPPASLAAIAAIARADNAYRPDYRPIRAPILALFGHGTAGLPFRPLLDEGPEPLRAEARRCAALDRAMRQRIGVDDLRAQRPDARIAVWPDAGHYLFIEQPARTAAAIEAFLAPGASTP